MPQTLAILSDIYWSTLGMFKCSYYTNKPLSGRELFIALVLLVNFWRHKCCNLINWHLASQMLFLFTWLMFANSAWYFIASLGPYKLFQIWAVVVVAQLVEWLLPTPEGHESVIFVHSVIRKDEDKTKIKNKEAGNVQILTKNHISTLVMYVYLQIFAFFVLF